VPLPDGFLQVQSTAGGYIATEGNTLRGVLLSRVERSIGGKPRWLYLVRVSHAGCKCKDAHGSEFVAEVGDIVSVEERAQLQELRPLADGRHELYLEALERRELGRDDEQGRPMTQWVFELGTRALTGVPKR
jgi:hypothetical protein